MKLGDVMKLSKGNLISIEDDKEYTIAGVQNYGAGILNKRTVKGFELTMKKYQLIEPNQLMWCKVDTKNGAFGVTKTEHANSLASTNMALAEIDLNKCHPEFIEYLFRISFFHEAITKASSGTTNRKYLTPTQLFENIEIPSFNKDEQLKWIEKVDSIKKSGISTELTHQLSLVKKLRQQLLQDAVQGKLVPQNLGKANTQETLTVPNVVKVPKKQTTDSLADEPASELLKRIKAIKDKNAKNNKPLPPIQPEEIPFEIPENWVWCRLGEIAYITSGSTPAQTAFVEKGIPYLKMYNLRNQKIDFFHKPQYIKEEVHNGQLKRCRAFSGDIIMNIVGPPLGKIAIIPYDLPECNFNQAAVLIRPLIKEMNQFIFWYLNELSEIKSIETKGVAGQDNISVTQAHNMRFPLPPLSEQNRIVQKLDELMQYCNALEASIKQSQSQNEQLLQQVLREALRKEPVGV